MTTSISDSGLVLASANLIDLRSTVPSSGSYTAGDIVLESTTSARISGWKRLTTGSGHVLNTDWVYFSGNPINSGTAVATTSGTSIDFTGIPATVNQITLLLNGVSTNGSNNYLVQIGAGSFTTSGYTAYCSLNTNNTSSTAGFIQTFSNAAAVATIGRVVLTRLTGNIWISEGSNGRSSDSSMSQSTGSLALGGVLDRLRLTTVGGADTFDAGTANILWEF